MTVEEIRLRLQSVASQERIAVSRRFFKEPVEPRGVAAPELKRIAADVYRAIKPWPVEQRNALCTGLWSEGKLEDGLLACYVYQRFAKQCLRREFLLFESWLDLHVTNWAQCDSVAPVLLAACLENDPQLMTRLPLWTESPNRWKRRAAATALLREAKAGRNTEMVFTVAHQVLADPDEMVQKGVGWLLKETYPKRPNETMQFLMPQLGRIPRLVIRYAAEKMTATDKAAVMSRF